MFDERLFFYKPYQYKVLLKGCKFLFMKHVLSLLFSFFLYLSAFSQNSLYVTTTGTTFGMGSKSDPMSLLAAIAAATPGTVIKIATGTYNINNPISLVSDVTFEGGFQQALAWVKTSLPGATIINRTTANPEGAANQQRLVAVYGNAVSNFRLQDITITTANANQDGQSTYGIHLTSCFDYKIIRTQVLPGNAAAGQVGTVGAAGANGSNGANGSGGANNSSINASGGAGGRGGGAGFGNGGPGGNNGGVGSNGATSTNARAGGGGGGGGAGGREDTDPKGGNGGTGGAVNGGTAQTGGGVGGVHGSPGQDGTNGVNGASGSWGSTGSQGSNGSHVAGFWTPGGLGSTGSDGAGGKGGVGGGGGGGEHCTFCNDGTGNGGGGAGGGGQGGAGGTGGRGGGSSFGIYLRTNGFNGIVDQSRIIAGTAGAGGIGGAGGSGGLRGQGGQGGTLFLSEVGEGGDGGDGGLGGNGGTGGSGRSGTAIYIYLSGGSVLLINNSSFNLAAQPVITVEDINSTNVTINYTSSASQTWDLGPGATPQIIVGMNVATQYASQGRKEIIYGAYSYLDFTNINTNPGTSLHFAGGNDLVNCGNNASINNLGRDGFTIEAWINPAIVSATRAIVHKTGDYNFGIVNGNLVAQIWHLGVANNARTVVTGTSTIPINSWTHVAAKWDGTNAMLYINGVADPSSTVTNTAVSAGNLYLGNSPAFSEPFLGIMDELRIWNRPLCVGEIQNNMNCSLNPAGQQGLVAFYTFDHGIAYADNAGLTTLTDGSIYGNDGTLTNFTLFNNASNWLEGTVTGTCTPFVINTLAGTAGGPTVTASDVVDVTGTSFIEENCGLIADILPAGATPVTGSIACKVTIDATVQLFNASPYLQRHYDIEPVTNAANATAIVTLYFTQTEFDNYTLVSGGFPDLPTGPADAAGIANLRITQYHGTGTEPGNYSGAAVLIDPVDTDIVWNAVLNRWEITIPVDGFSGFYVHTNSFGNYPLPAYSINLSGSNKGAYNELQWNSSVNEPGTVFELERSTDGIQYNGIAIVPAQGTNTSNWVYTYNDAVNGSNPPVYFYRIKMILTSGAFKYSSQVKVNPYKNGFYVEAGPNPFAGEIRVSINSTLQEQARISLSNITGQIVWQQKNILQQAVNTVMLTGLDAFHPGIYFLTIKTQTQKKTIKLIKQ